MSSSKLSPYIVQELPDITESIKYPLRSVQRIKYTCFDVSKSLIAFGATSGGIYVFNRIPCEFIQLIPNKDGAITRVAISSDEKRIGFSNGRGVVTVTECDQSTQGSQGATSKEHVGNEVTAMAWSGSMLFIGDDVGRISVLQLHSFIAKTVFHCTSQTIMNLDSRICQIDMKSYMLLVSTLTRCYICDTSQEQYRQIGQKLRDGEFGACFVTKDTHTDCSPTCNTVHDFTEPKKYNIVNEELAFAVSKEVQNTTIYCARPSSRLWEASIDGTVKRTHQFKQVLAKRAMNIITLDSYAKENVCIENIHSEDGQSVIFSKIYSLNSAIFSFKRDALYFLNVDDVDNTLWFDAYKDIVDCKVHNDTAYVWLSNSSLVTLKYMKIDKFLLKCYLDEKYVLCGEMCALFSDYLLCSAVSPNLHILVGLRDKLKNQELLNTIENVLKKIDSLKNDATQLKSGIFVVDNTYHAQSLLNDGVRHEDYKFGALPPEAMQTLKDISLSVSDKLITSKNMLKEKWVDFEGKMKNLNNEKQIVPEIPKRIHRDEYVNDVPTVDEEIIFKESSQNAIITDNNLDSGDEGCKSLYQYYRLSLVGKNDDANLLSTIEKQCCDINEICSLMTKVEQYCVSIGATDDASYVASYIFLNYLNISKDLLDSVVNNDVLYKYFVDSCITVNMRTQKVLNLGCECGYPLPYLSNETTMFSKLIDDFIERQWAQTRDQCYDMCKKMPFLWRKILYMRRNEDLLNILRLLLQMLDENILHSFLPQFTLDTWDRTVQLYATLHANMCLNCGKKFHHILVKETLSWDDLGALMIKSVGGKNAMKIMEKHASLVATGELTMKFYHTSLLVTMYETCDVTITNQLTDALYSCSVFEDSKAEICNLLRNSPNSAVKNTALPITIAAKTTHWGLSPIQVKLTEDDSEVYYVEDISFNKILDNLPLITNGVTDCLLCGLPLNNQVLIQDGGLWVFKCGHTFHGECLDLNKIRLCPSCYVK